MTTPPDAPPGPARGHDLFTAAHAGRAAFSDAGEPVGVVARVEPHPGLPSFGVICGRHTLMIQAAENVRSHWHAVAFPDGSIGGRAPGERGRRGVKTLRGARWTMATEKGKIGTVAFSGSGPRGGRPR
jgi:hypothetical protein